MKNTETKGFCLIIRIWIDRQNPFLYFPTEDIRNRCTMKLILWKTGY